MFHEGPIRIKEVAVVLEVAVGVIRMAVEVEAAAEGVAPTRMVGTNIMSSLEVIIQGIITAITIGEEGEGVVGHLTTITMDLFKLVKPQPALGLVHDVDRMHVTSFMCGW